MTTSEFASIQCEVAFQNRYVLTGMNQNVRLDNFQLFLKMTTGCSWFFDCQAEQQLSVTWLSWEHVESFAGASKHALTQQYLSKSRNLCLKSTSNAQQLDSVFLYLTKGCIKNWKDQLTNHSTNCLYNFTAYWLNFQYSL